MTREIALHCMKSASELESELCEECPIYGQTGCDHCYEDALQYVIAMLEQEPTNKNDLGVDAVSRREVLYLIADHDLSMGQVVRGIHELPSVAPQEPILDKIRAEIMNCLKALDEIEKSGFNIYLPNEISGRRLTYQQCLEFIDKYKAEVEPQENGNNNDGR